MCSCHILDGHLANQPRVSVIIPMYNASKYIAEALDSVIAQTYTNTEIIAINDGSTDGTDAVIKPYLGLNGFKYIEQENKGVSAARNQGLRAAEGELIAFLDSDDQWLPDKLEKQVAFLHTNSEVGLVHRNIHFMDESGQPLSREISDFDTDASGWCFKTLFEENRIATLTVCMRRECFLKIGFFREDIRGGEDYEYWLRVSRCFSIGHIDQNLALYRMHGANATRNWMPQLIDLSKALEGILDQFPEARSVLGKKAIKNRLLPIHMRIAHELYRQNDHHSARPHLMRALALNPWNLPFYRMLLMGYLPSQARRALRWYAQKLIQ